MIETPPRAHWPSARDLRTLLAAGDRPSSQSDRAAVSDMQAAITRILGTEVARRDCAAQSGDLSECSPRSPGQTTARTPVIVVVSTGFNATSGGLDRTLTAMRYKGNKYLTKCDTTVAKYPLMKSRRNDAGVLPLQQEQRTHKRWHEGHTRDIYWSIGPITAIAEPR